MRQEHGRVGDEVIGDAGNAQGSENFARLGAARPAGDEGFVVHRHELLEDFEVTLWVGRGRKEATQNAGSVQNERLAALPIGTQCGKGLAAAGHLLPVSLGG